MTFFFAAAVLGALATTVSAHGHVTGVVADGVYFQGYEPSMQFSQNPPAVVGWSCPQCLDNGFVGPELFTSSDIACHKGATPGAASAKVKAGGKVELQWTAWPESHHGPVIDYLAKCNGNCQAETASSLRFFKINQGGLVDGSTPPGTWASDQLIASNNSWTLTIPASIAPGNYVLRHEIIALHAAGQTNGAQNYPQCINLEVSGSGTTNPAGVAATSLYKPTDVGILFNIYTKLASYPIPGPALFSSGGGGGNAAQPSAPASSAAQTSTRAASTAPATSAAATSAPATTASPTSSPATSAAPTSTTPTTTPIPPLPTHLIPVVSNISTLFPSTLLTAPIPTATPTDPSIPRPSKPIPQGATIKDLIDWLSFMLRTQFSNAGQGQGQKAGAGKNGGRGHPRAF